MVLLDNTVLSNFALVNHLDLLSIALGNQAATTTQVIQEYNRGVARGVLPNASWEWLEILELTSQEKLLFKQHLLRVNEGEAACLAVAVVRNGLVFTDDRDARKLAAQLKISVSGTIGILSRLNNLGIISRPEANRLLSQMIEKGYRSPIKKWKICNSPS